MAICDEYKIILKEAVSRKKQVKRFFESLKKCNEKKMNHLFNKLHHEVFNDIDCLKCGNCCSSISPMISDNDIQKMAKALKEKPSKVTSIFLKLDKDHDYVFTTLPCPFLDTYDNRCSIYGSRPKACCEYPHTDRQNVMQISHLTYKNIFVCPAVYTIVKNLEKS